MKIKWPVVAQLAGAAVSLVGLYLLVGLAVMLFAGGLMLATAGMFREGGRI